MVSVLKLKAVSLKSCFAKSQIAINRSKLLEKQ